MSQVCQGLVCKGQVFRHKSPVVRTKFQGARRCKQSNKASYWGAAFSFFPVKIKSARESHFWPFFEFFHGHFSFFTPTFWPIFQFFHAHFFFHGHFFSVFSRFLHGYTNRFHGRSLSKKLSFSRGKLLKIFHGHRFFSRVEF